MRVKRTWFLLFLMVCVVFGLQSGTVSAAGEQITVNGRNILQEPGHTVSCSMQKSAAKWLNFSHEATLFLNS